MLLAREQAAMREELAAAFDARGVLFEAAPLGRMPSRLMPLAGPPLSLPLLRSPAPMPVLMSMRTPSIRW